MHQMNYSGTVFRNNYIPLSGNKDHIKRNTDLINPNSQSESHSFFNINNSCDVREENRLNGSISDYCGDARIGENIDNQNINSWPYGTVCILGDSILCNIDEKRLGRNVKVRFHRGGTVDDMFDHVKPILKRKPTFLIIHAGSNNSTYDNEKTILIKLFNLKKMIEDQLPTCTVIFSTPVMRQDNTKANNVQSRLSTLLHHSNVAVVNNDNMDSQHLGKKGLHLNQRGQGRLALNFKSYLRCL